MANVQLIGFDEKEAQKLFSHITSILMFLGFNDESAVVSVIYHELYAREEQEEGIHLIGYNMLDDNAYFCTEDDFPKDLNYSVIDSDAVTTGPMPNHAPYFSVFAKSVERIEEIVSHMRTRHLEMDIEKHLIHSDAEILEYPCIRILSDIEEEFLPITIALQVLGKRIYKKKVSFVPASGML